MIPKAIKYKTIYDEVWGDFFYGCHMALPSGVCNKPRLLTLFFSCSLSSVNLFLHEVHLVFVSEVCWTTKYSVVVKSNFPKAIPVNFDKQLYGPLPLLSSTKIHSQFMVYYIMVTCTKRWLFFVLWIMK